MIAGAVHLAALAQPVALGAARRSPWSTGRPGSPGRARRRRTTCRAAASCRRRCAPRGRLGAFRAEACELVERDAVAREARRAGLAGEPVDVAATLRIEHLLARRARGAARDGCTTGRSGSPPRHRCDRPLRHGRAPDAIGRDGMRRIDPARATPRTASTRCGGATSRWPLAAAASVAIMPAMPSALARAWPWPQPSAHGVDDRAAAAFLPVVVAEAAPVGAGGAAADDAGIERHRLHQVHRRAEPCRRAARSSAGRRRPEWSSASDRGDAPRIAERGAGTAGRACRSRCARRRSPRSSRTPTPAACTCHGRRQPAKRLVAAEHAVEEARRVGAHQLAAQAVARGHWRPSSSPPARRRASARRPRDRKGRPPP